MTTGPANQVMWFGTVQHLPLEEQLRAASLAGCTVLSTGVHEYLARLAGGVPTRDMKAMAADHGVSISHIDPFVRWVPRWQPDPAHKIAPRYMNYDEDDFFRVADALEAKSVSVVGAFQQGSVEMPELIDGFGRFCERAAAAGLRCDLEFVPFFGVTHLAMAWEIVKTVDAPNSGILLDFWHYSRGTPDDALLRSIPGHRITGVQFDDGVAALKPGMSIMRDTMRHRCAPGQGEFRIREIVSILRDIGGLNNIGPEIYLHEFDALGADAIAEICRTSMAWALAED